MIAGGAYATLSPALLQGASAKSTAPAAEAYQVFNNVCPRNCFDACSIKTHVKDGVIKFIEGSDVSSYTKGGLCVKGYTYTRRVYEPSRIKYPMIQDGRGTGNWRRISWDEAIDTIAKKFLEIKAKDGHLLGLGLNKYSGNFGITKYGVEGFMSSLGYTTRFISNPCSAAGEDAQVIDFGAIHSNDPEDFEHSRYIIVWGANPAWCAMHSMKLLYKAKQNGARVLVIDPIFSQTAAKADEFWRIKPGQDGALALGMARHILDQGLVDENFVKNHAVGFDAFATYLRENITVEWAAEQSGIDVNRLKQVAEAFAKAKPATIWVGTAIQRHNNGGTNVRAVDALVAMTGNVGKVGGGARFTHSATWGFNYAAMTQTPPEGAIGVEVKDEAGNISYTNRKFNINRGAQEILDSANPPLRVLWSACRNPMSQDADLHKMRRAFEKLEMVISVEEFFTETVKYSDIVLPVTSFFEEPNVTASYWHYWIGLNEQAIAPLHECKSDNQIHALIAKRMNELSPGSCTFPQNLSDQQFMEQEFNEGIYGMLGIKDWRELKAGPIKASIAANPSWHDMKFKTPSGKYEFSSERAAQHGYNPLPVYMPPRQPTAAYQLLSPHTQFGIHSQFANIDWMQEFNPEPYAYIHPDLAQREGIEDLSPIKLKNHLGEIELKAKIARIVPDHVVLVYEAWFPGRPEVNVETVIDDTLSDMGYINQGALGTAIHDQFVNIEKI